eukprot:CFRG1744T1
MKALRRGFSKTDKYKDKLGTVDGKGEQILDAKDNNRVPVHASVVTSNNEVPQHVGDQADTPSTSHTDSGFSSPPARPVPVDLDEPNPMDFKSTSSTLADKEILPTVDAKECKLPVERLNGLTPQQSISLLQERISDFHWQLENENIILAKLNEYTHVKGERSRQVFVEYMDQSRIVHLNRDILQRAIHLHENAVVKAEMQIVAGANVRLKHRYSELNGEMEMMKEDHRDQLNRLDSGRAILNRHTVELNAKIEDLKKENTELETRLIHSTAQIANSSSSSNSQQDDLLAEEIASLRVINSKLAQENKELTSYCKLAVEKETEAVSRLDELNDEMSLLKERVESDAHTVTRAEQQIKDSLAQVAALDARLEQSTRFAHEFEMKLTIAMTEKGALESQLEEKQKVVGTLQKQIFEVTEEKDACVGMSEQRKLELDRLMAKLRSLEDKNQQQARDIDQATDRISQLTSACEQLKTASMSETDMSEEFVKVNRGFEKAQEELSEIKKRDAENVYTISRLEEKYNAVKHEHQDTASRLEAVILAHKAELDDTRKQRDSQISDLTLTLRGINEQKENEKADVIRLKDKELAELRRLRTEALDIKQKEIDRISAERENLRSTKTKMAKELQRGRDRMMALEKEVFAHVSNNADLNSRLMHVTDQMDDARQRLEDLQHQQTNDARGRKNRFGL